MAPARYRIEPAALEVLRRHEWPGNVRELANLLERAQILAENHTITLDDLPDSIGLDAAPGEPTAPPADPRNLRELERRHVQDVLKQFGNNKVQAARALGISRRALYRLLGKYQPDSPVTEPQP